MSMLPVPPDHDSIDCRLPERQSVPLVVASPHSGSHYPAEFLAEAAVSLAALRRAEDAFVDELFAADIIVIGVPMYNFAVPTQLKAWIDRSLVAGRTFHYTPTGPEGLLPKGKTVIVVSSRGGFYGPDSPLGAFDHQEAYLRQALGFVGLTDVTVIRAEGLAVSPESKEAALAAARQSISSLAA